MISIEETVCTREQSERLIELGVVLNTFHHWENIAGIWTLLTYECVFTEEMIPAPSCAELMTLFPWIIETPSIYNLLIWKVTNKGWNVEYFNDLNRPLMNRFAGNLSNVLSDRLIWLIENNHIQPDSLKL